MHDFQNKRRPEKPPERNPTALWFVAGGLAVALYSHGMKDEMIGNVVFWFGLACSAVALIYWAIRPKHGL